MHCSVLVYTLVSLCHKQCCFFIICDNQIMVWLPMASTWMHYLTLLFPQCIKSLCLTCCNNNHKRTAEIDLMTEMFSFCDCFTAVVGHQCKILLLDLHMIYNYVFLTFIYFSFNYFIYFEVASGYKIQLHCPQKCFQNATKWSLSGAQ